MADMGLNTYRFSVEWARVEPAEGTIDESEIGHYRDVADQARALGITPMATLNHFSLPRWVAAQGGWTSDRTAGQFERYVRRVVAGLGDAVDWYCTINEPATVATGGYVGRWGFPPGVVDVGRWKKAIAGLIDGHVRARDAIHDVRPDARAGMAVFSSERVANAGGRVASEFARYWNEDIYLEAAAEDDFIGVQTYTREMLNLPRVAASLTRLALAIRPVENFVVPRVLGMKDPLAGARAYRVTQMGWEYRPEALAAVVRRIAGVYPDKDLVVTEHGVATLDDADRVEFIARGLAALHDAIADGVHLRGYIHWSLLDNYEWATGYGANFGLVSVDRATQERTVRASGRFLGEIARTGSLDPAAIPFRSAGQ
jgi:beta-glucosidase